MRTAHESQHNKLNYLIAPKPMLFTTWLRAHAGEHQSYGILACDACLDRRFPMATKLATFKHYLQGTDALASLPAAWAAYQQYKSHFEHIGQPGACEVEEKGTYDRQQTI